MKLNKDFFEGNEVLFMGYSSNTSKNVLFSRQVYKAFTNGGIKVYPLNSKKDGQYDIKVYRELGELPRIPKTAYILLKNENTKEVLKQLGENNVKRILFQNKKVAGPEILDACSKMGIEAAIACPMMIFGSGFHKFHAFMAGVRK